MQVVAASSFLTPTFDGKTYYATASALASQGPITNTTNHISFHDSAQDTTYCSHASVDTFTPSTSTTIVADRSFTWLNQTVLTLAMTTDDCPASYVAPYCTGLPTSSSTAFSHIMGYTLSKSVDLTGSNIYMAKLTSTPGVTRVKLTSHSGPVDVVLLDENNFLLFAAGANFRFYSWFSFFSVENLDETVNLSGDMTGNYYYMITYARASEKTTIKPVSTDISIPNQSRIHSKLYKLLPVDASTTEPAPTPLSISLMVSTAAVDSTLIPIVAKAWSQELYVESDSGALPTWLLGIIIGGGVLALLGLMAIVVCCTRRKDRGERSCCSCCYKKPEPKPAPYERRTSLQNKPIGDRRASMQTKPAPVSEWPSDLKSLSLVTGRVERGGAQWGVTSMQARQGTMVELGSVSPKSGQRGLYSAYGLTSVKTGYKGPQKSTSPKAYTV